MDDELELLYSLMIKRLGEMPFYDAVMDVESLRDSLETQALTLFDKEFGPERNADESYCRCDDSELFTEVVSDYVPYCVSHCLTCGKEVERQ